MRYAIGMTIVDPKTKKVSSPYLLIYDEKTQTLVPMINNFKNLKGKKLIFARGNDATFALDSVRNLLKIAGANFYLLKIDSFNFPYQISNDKWHNCNIGRDLFQYERIVELKG